MLLRMGKESDAVGKSELITEVAVTASPWDQDASGRRWVGLRAKVDVSSGRSALRVLRYRLVVGRRNTNVPLQTVDAVGMVGGGHATSYLYADVKLVPGEYQVGEPGHLGGYARFRLPSAPHGPVMLCFHAIAKPSAIETRLLMDEGHRPAWGDQRMILQKCCRENLAAWRSDNAYILRMFRPLRGVLRVTVNGREWLVKPGQYLIMNPSDTGGPSDVQRWPVDYLKMMVGQSALRQVREAVGLPKAWGSFGFEAGPRRAGRDLERAWALWDSAREMGVGIGGEAFWRAAGHAFMIGLLREHPNALRLRVEGSPGVGGPDARFQTILTYLRDHLGQSLEMKRIAREHGVSARWLRTQFQDRLGKNPVEFIQDLRVQRATELLKDPAWKIDDIAGRVGYKDASAFYRMFKAHQLSTPRMLRP